jgi:hypothetical protein
MNLDNPDRPIDDSVFPKKGQLGFVDKTFITESEEGARLAKVRIREERMPNIGDKFASRAGQKGTVGVLIREQDMPFTADGIKPDIIINPHAIPSRMTIGQLVETLVGKACSLYGAFGDCTAFLNTGPKEKKYGKLLVNQGFHSSGTQILYNGMTGEQIQSDIYIGPTYYMRLKHMVKDKINYRARGPRTLLTRQTVQGRANDGGLRVGEMERDGIIAHGISHFLQESMMIRGDEYFMAICNKTGTIAIYNSMRDLFISPMADGPIKFTGNLLSEMNIDKVTKFGRSFSIIRIPYSFKLLMQELLTMNVSMRIITEDNIDQLESMSYSKTVNKLMFDDTPQTTDVISRVIESNKDRSSVGYIASKTSRKAELEKRQDNTNAILLDNQKAQEKMLKDIENLGWRLESRELIEGSDGEGTPKRYRYVFASLILDERGSPTELWDGPAGGYGQFPNTHPVGWSEKDLLYTSGEKIPDEIMANELARNQTPNNWLSSYINIVQEHQKVMYRKKIMEEAKERAEQGIEEGAAMGTPIYIPGSPEYTASSPIYGSSFVGQPAAMSYGAAAEASAAGLVGTSPLGSPQYGLSSPQYGLPSPEYSSINSPVVLTGQPMNVVIPANPLQPVVPAAQGILSVDTQKPKEEGKDEAQGKKTVMVNLEK